MSKKLLTRRRVLVGSAAVAGGGLALAWLTESHDERPVSSLPGVFEPNAFLQITPDGQIILQVDRLEMGQGVITGFVTLLADELEVSPTQIEPRLAPVREDFQTPTQSTGESQSMRMRWNVIRETGAIARSMLLKAAAETWGVEVAEVAAKGDATIVHTATGRQLAYGDVATRASKLPVPDAPVLKTRDAFRWIGARVARPDLPAKVTGSAEFGIDVELPNLSYATVARAPSIGAQLMSADLEAARAADGVIDVFEIHSGVAVVAESWWYARDALRKLQLEWSETSLELDANNVHDEQREVLARDELVEGRDDGDFDVALSNAHRVIDAEFELPYLAHATMEPMNATVSLTDERCDVWTGTQGPDLTRAAVRSMTGLKREQIHIHTTLAGGGFGRRIMNDFVADAVAIAMKMKEKKVSRPIKLLWSREDDIRHDYFRGANFHRLRVALDQEERPTGWHHQVVTLNITPTFMPDVIASKVPEWIPDGAHRRGSMGLTSVFARFFGPFQAYDGSVTMPYEFDSVRVEFGQFETGVPSGIWRAVGNQYNAFAVESIVDELAEAANQDPFTFRRAHLTKSDRHLAVLEKLETASRWGDDVPGRHKGLALHAAYGSVVGQVADVSVDDSGSIAVHRVTCVVDCGVAINPDVIRGQMESGIIFGLTAALFGRIDIENGAVMQSNFHDYRMIRMDESPEIDVHILESGDAPGGIGEAGTPPIAPALANALYAATGKRLRRMPFKI